VAANVTYSQPRCVIDCNKPLLYYCYLVKKKHFKTGFSIPNCDNIIL